MSSSQKKGGKKEKKEKIDGKATPRMKWHEFAKQYQAEHKLTSYTEALQQATGEWKKYKESFSTSNPGYNHDEFLKAERMERKRKIAAGELEAPKKRGGGIGSPEKGAGAKGGGKKKEVGEVDSDGDYDVVERVVTTKKRRRAGSEYATYKVPTSITDSSSSPPKRKRARKQATPKKLEEEQSVVPKVGIMCDTVPSSYLSHSMDGAGAKKPEKKKREEKAKLTYTQQSDEEEEEEISCAQEPEEDFIQNQHYGVEEVFY